MDIAKPESLGLSSKRLGRVTEWLEQQISDGRLAGAGVLIARHGQNAYFETAGAADLTSGQKFERDTIVRMFSMTKAVTTVAAMMLYERGAFQLDDPISRYLPAFADMMVWQGDDRGLDGAIPALEPITVRHLMTHTSGLTYGFMQTNAVDAAYRERGAEPEPHGNQSLAQWCDVVAEIPLIAEPGTQWNYSVSSDVLGRLVEVWSGHTLSEFFDREIFEPLQMIDTGFHVRSENHGRLAALYGPEVGGGMASVGRAVRPTEVEQRGGLKLHETAARSPYREAPALFSGGGGLTGTAGDYGRFCQMLQGGGELDGSRLLGRKTVEYMRTNQLPDNRDMAAMGQPVWSETSYDGIGFGLGFAVVIDPVKAAIITSPGEHHWGGAASTFFWLDPVEALHVVFVTQLIPSSTYPIRRELRARVYQALVD